MAQGATGHFRPPARAVVAFVEQDRAMLVEHAAGLAARMDEGAKRVMQAGRLQRPLAALRMDVEHAALAARLRRGVRFIDGGGDAVDVQHAGEHQPAQARADDGDRHDAPRRWQLLIF
jgi:hypothetical protein